MPLLRLLRYACLCFLTIILLAVPDGAAADDRPEIEMAEAAIPQVVQSTTPARWRTGNWFLLGVTPQYIDDCRTLEALEARLQLCLINRECGARRQQEIALGVYDMKQPCT